MSKINALKKVQVEMPVPESNGHVVTLNKMGFMTSHLDPYSKAFIQAAASANGPVLEIGAAYGVAVIPTLATGAKVIANDLDQRHLDILRAKVDDRFQSNLTTSAGDFLKDLKINSESLGAILIVRVLHFLDGATIERAARLFYSWLAPGGAVYAVTETPFLRGLESFVPLYEERRARGEPFPGCIEDFSKYQPQRAKSLPSLLNVLDPDVMRRVFTEAGFVIEKVGLFPRPYYPEDVKLDGREGVGVIARKA